MGSFAALETGGQIYSLLHPTYEVLAWEPDPEIGWKLVPDLQFTWTGVDPYLKDFSASISVHPLGFRDLPEDELKSRGTTRVALLGDSFVESLQVPIDQTAGRLLEGKLNAPLQRRESPERFEVLNFGISSHGLGQSYLTWETYGRPFSPDYVFVFLSSRSLERTVDPYESGAFPPTRQKKLKVRPVFRLEEGKLILEPARDFQAFVETQTEVIRTEFGSRGRLRRRKGIFLKWAAAQALRWGEGNLLPFWRRARQNFFSSRNPSILHAPLTRSSLDPTVLEVNLSVLEQWGKEIKEAGGKLVLVDALSYGTSSPVSSASKLFRRLAARNGWGYIPLADELSEAERKGISVHWPHDGHFNQAGNEIFAEAMHRWFAENLQWN